MRRFSIIMKAHLNHMIIGLILTSIICVSRGPSDTSSTFKFQFSAKNRTRFLALRWREGDSGGKVGIGKKHNFNFFGDEIFLMKMKKKIF